MTDTMNEQHRATPQQWALVGRMRHCVEFSTILELRDRVEALEKLLKMITELQ